MNETDSSDAPGRVEVDADGTRIERWYRGGKLHRTGGPAHIEIRADGSRSMDGTATASCTASTVPPGLTFTPTRRGTSDGTSTMCRIGLTVPHAVIVKPDGSRVEELVDRRPSDQGSMLCARSLEAGRPRQALGVRPRLSIPDKKLL